MRTRDKFNKRAIHSPHLSSDFSLNEEPQGLSQLLLQKAGVDLHDFSFDNLGTQKILTKTDPMQFCPEDNEYFQRLETEFGKKKKKKIVADPKKNSLTDILKLQILRKNNKIETINRIECRVSCLSPLAITDEYNCQVSIYETPQIRAQLEKLQFNRTLLNLKVSFSSLKIKPYSHHDNLEEVGIILQLKDPHFFSLIEVESIAIKFKISPFEEDAELQKNFYSEFGIRVGFDLKGCLKESRKFLRKNGHVRLPQQPKNRFLHRLTFLERLSKSQEDQSKDSFIDDGISIVSSLKVSPNLHEESLDQSIKITKSKKKVRTNRVRSNRIKKSKLIHKQLKKNRKGKENIKNNLDSPIKIMAQTCLDTRKTVQMIGILGSYALLKKIHTY